MTTPAQNSRAVFDGYAAIDFPHLPSLVTNLAALQVELARWQSTNFGPARAEHLALGVAEEAGELAHAVLKRAQRIRGMEDREAFIELAGDAIADTTIYLMQLATLLRLDFATLVDETASKVMSRDWIDDPTGANHD